MANNDGGQANNIEALERALTRLNKAINGTKKDINDLQEKSKTASEEELVAINKIIAKRIIITINALLKEINLSANTYIISLIFSNDFSPNTFT